MPPRAAPRALLALLAALQLLAPLAAPPPLQLGAPALTGEVQLQPGPTPPTRRALLKATLANAGGRKRNQREGKSPGGSGSGGDGGMGSVSDVVSSWGNFGQAAASRDESLRRAPGGQEGADSARSGGWDDVDAEEARRVATMRQSQINSRFGQEEHDSEAPGGDTVPPKRASGKRGTASKIVSSLSTPSDTPMAAKGSKCSTVFVGALLLPELGGHTRAGVKVPAWLRMAESTMLSAIRAHRGQGCAAFLTDERSKFAFPELRAAHGGSLEVHRYRGIWVWCKPDKEDPTKEDCRDHTYTAHARMIAYERFVRAENERKAGRRNVVLVDTDLFFTGPVSGVFEKEPFDIGFTYRPSKEWHFFINAGVVFAHRERLARAATYLAMINAVYAKPEVFGQPLKRNAMGEQVAMCAIARNFGVNKARPGGSVKDVLIRAPASKLPPDALLAAEAGGVGTFDVLFVDMGRYNYSPKMSSVVRKPITHKP